MRHTTTVVFGCALALASALCPTARAQEIDTYLRERVAAPSDALELKVGTAYTQGFGNIAPGRPMQNSGGPGFGVGADVDYRIDHYWSIGVEGQYQAFGTEQNTSAMGLATNVGATYHFMPTNRGDPWARLGTGYRLFWENNPSDVPTSSTVVRHGFELATLKLGYDVRVSEDVALGPVVGADLNVFTFQDNNTISPAQWGTFIYAGMQGRFDVSGERGGLPTVAYVPPPVGVTAPQPQAPPPAPVEEPKPVSPHLAVSEDILAACKMNLDSVEKAPKFEFDKADLLPADMDVIKQIADCFTTGPMKDQGMRLVGRADPRGTLDYNDKLGMRRANEVATHLGELGVSADRIDKISRGKRDARGTDEASWAIDRRVDILER